MNLIRIAAVFIFLYTHEAVCANSRDFLQFHHPLQKLTADSDLVFKGRAISSQLETNAGFPYWGKSHATEFEVISILKGSISSNVVMFWHNTAGPMIWSGPNPPPDYTFETGQCYVVFAANADKPDWLYTPASNHIFKPNEFRQLQHGEIASRTLDAEPVTNLSVNEAHWIELSKLLKDSNPTNQLYALAKLDSMSLAGRHYDEFRRSDDFKREVVLKTLLPLTTNSNDQIACRAISCFGSESNDIAVLETFSEVLISIANSSSANRQLAAIGGLSGTHFNEISNSLTLLLHHPNESVRTNAVGLLALFSGEFVEQSLREHSTDPSLKVRATVADVIGAKKITSLLPTLADLFAQHFTQPTTLELNTGVRANLSDYAHKRAGFALLEFDLEQIREILNTNLNDSAFRLSFLCKLAEDDAKPWLDAMAEQMETRRRQSQESGKPLYLYGVYYRCWKIVYEHLKGLPFVAFAGGKSDRYLNMLEQAGNTGSQEPIMLYELYKMKGLNKRAAQFRKDFDALFPAYEIGPFLDRVDAKYPNNGFIPDQ